MQLKRRLKNTVPLKYFTKINNHLEITKLSNSKGLIPEYMRRIWVNFIDKY